MKDTGIPAARRVLLLASPKGGVGKSSLCRNILVSASYAGLKVVGVDLDPQATLLKWHGHREQLRATFPGVRPVSVVPGSLDEWRKAVALAETHDLVVIDTPPSVEVHYGATISLCSAAHHVLVPTGATQDDVDSVTPWMQTLAVSKVSASFVLNRANSRVNSHKAMQTRLLAAGQLCPVVIPLLEDIHLSAAKGLAVPDLISRRHQETFVALWSYVAREVGLPVSEAILPADPRVTAPEREGNTPGGAGAVTHSEEAKGLAMAAVLAQLVEELTHDVDKRIAAMRARLNAIISKK